MICDIRVGQAYVGDDGQWCYFTQADATAYNQGAKDAYYHRSRRTLNSDYAKGLTDKQLELYHVGYNDAPFGEKDF